MGIWAWIQPVDRIWKVISDQEKGTLQVYDEKSELVMESKGLSKEEISFIETNFLQIVAINISGNKEDIPIVSDVVRLIEHNYMYA
ncbi:MAG: hypothetical protein OIN87_13690 [Candidatus Methanoperedens sp.]|nr:hypothetical protein [Candidatus Methanoperedens sp.]